MSTGTFSIYQSEYRIVSHLQSSLLPTIFNIFAWNFAWVILMTSPIKHMTRKKCSSKLINFSKISVFVAAGLIILFKFLFVYFSPGLQFGMEKRKIFNFIGRISKLCSVWYLFKIKLSKSELNIWVGSFSIHVPPILPSPTEKCGEIRIGAPDDLSDVNTKFENL